jgi:hypothetical protein
MVPKGKKARAVIASALAIATAAVLAFGPARAATVSTASASTHHAAGSALVDEGEFHDAIRRLWVDHVTWTRLFIVSFVADLPDLQATTDRLLQNQVDIGDAIEPFYGQAAADELTALLREHILTAADLLQAAKSGDDAAFAEAKDAWYANADEIARFLHRANPRNWPLADLREMMKEHLDLTLTEAAAQLGGDYTKSVATYDDVEDEILHMADTLSDGVIAQFPKRFA